MQSSQVGLAYYELLQESKEISAKYADFEDELFGTQGESRLVLGSLHALWGDVEAEGPIAPSGHVFGIVYKK